MRILLIVFLIIAGGLIGSAAVLLWIGNVKASRATWGGIAWLYFTSIVMGFMAGGSIVFSFLHRLRIERLFLVLTGLCTISFIGWCCIQMGAMTQSFDVRVSSLFLGTINGVIVPVLICAILYQKNVIRMKSKAS